ncbi:MAG: DUF3885 domain-containing protein [Helicobacteraceae bacterium]|nr:DUF3885 domain-containing protein [Helicobacteraceae bacterium]
MTNENQLFSEFSRFLDANFAGLEIKKPLFYNWRFALRFDLQDFTKMEAKKPTQKYFVEVVERARELYTAAFKPEDKIYVFYRKWDFGINILSEINELKNDDFYEFTERGTYEGAEFSFETTLICAEAKKLNMDKVLIAISNLDYDRVPKIDGEVYIFNIKNKLIFNMYDDRGLDMIASEKWALSQIYKHYYKYLLDYDLKKMKIAFA